MTTMNATTAPPTPTTMLTAVEAEVQAVREQVIAHLDRQLEQLKEKLMRIHTTATGKFQHVMGVSQFFLLVSPSGRNSTIKSTKH